MLHFIAHITCVNVNEKLLSWICLVGVHFNQWPSCKRFLLNSYAQISFSCYSHEKQPNKAIYQRKKMVPFRAFLAFINTLGLEAPTGSRSAISNTWKKAFPSELGAVIGYQNEV